MRTFETGATRNKEEGKNDYEGFLSPEVLEVFGDYMTSHRKQADGKLRDSDNWQKGIPREVYMKSLLRHTFDLWKIHRGIECKDKQDGHVITVKEACSAIMFNVMGYLFEVIRGR